jgi:hypothetical protein
MSTMPTSAAPIGTAGQLVALTLIVVTSLGLRLYHLDQQSLWIDEVSSIEVARQPLREIVLNYRPGRHPWHGAEQAPLSFVTMNLFFSPAAAATSARLPSVLFGVAGVLALYSLMRELSDEAGAWTSAALLSLSPLHVWYSQEARWYALWILLTILSYRALLHAWRAPSKRTWLLYTLFTALNIYTFVLSFLLMACQGLSSLFLARRHGGMRFIAAVALAQLAAAVAAAPVLWLIMNTLGLTTGTPRPLGLAQLPYTFFVYAAGYSLGPTVTLLHALPGVMRIIGEHPVVVGVAGVFGPLAILGMWQVRRWPVAAAILLPWCFGPLLLSGVLALVSNVTFQARYSSAALPAFLALLALGLVATRPAILRIVVTLLVVGTFAASLANHYWNPLYFKEDSRSVGAHLQTTAAAAPVYVVGQIQPAVAYYAPQLHVVDVPTCSDRGFEGSSDKQLWLVVGRDWEVQGPGCVGLLSATHRIDEHRQFPGIEVWLFSAKQDPTMGALS